MKKGKTKVRKVVELAVHCYLFPNPIDLRGFGSLTITEIRHQENPTVNNNH